MNMFVAALFTLLPMVVLYAIIAFSYGVFQSDRTAKVYYGVFHAAAVGVIIVLSILIGLLTTIPGIAAFGQFMFLLIVHAIVRAYFVYGKGAM